MYEETLFMKDGKINYTTYECSKQYRCVNILWLLSVFTYKVRKYRDIISPEHVLSNIDGMNGYDKSY